VTVSTAIDTPSGGPLVIERAGPDALDRLQPLWEGMQEHHARVGQTWPLRSPASSWALRRESYGQWLGEPGAFVLIARLDEVDVGYVFGRVTPGWIVVDTGPRIGWIESLAVRPEHRGAGIGGRLMNRACSEFQAQGTETVALSVLADNAGAIRFYEAHGMTPTTVTYLGHAESVLTKTSKSNRGRLAPADRWPHSGSRESREP
jgi:ribosomal protein S18 acetylase RimI-like enzyme